jgi:hypothetical protein
MCSLTILLLERNAVDQRQCSSTMYVPLRGCILLLECVLLLHTHTHTDNGMPLMNDDTRVANDRDESQALAQALRSSKYFNSSNGGLSFNRHPFREQKINCFKNQAYTLTFQNVLHLAADLLLARVGVLVRAPQ